MRSNQSVSSLLALIDDRRNVPGLYRNTGDFPNQLLDFLMTTAGNQPRPVVFPPNSPLGQLQRRFRR